MTTRGSDNFYKTYFEGFQWGATGNSTQYTVDVGCYNCHADVTVSVAKGQLLDTVPCPKCGCKTLIPRK